MPKLIFIPLVCFLSLAVVAQKLDYPLQTVRSIDYASLQKGFVTPPAEARLRCYWWWLNSMATKASITRDLEEMKRNGYGGASVVDAGSSNYTVAAKSAAGPVFMSPAWMELYKHAVKEAQRLGIELSVNTQSGWNPGGPAMTPELAQKKLVYSETRVQGGRRIDTILPEPPVKLLYKDVAVQAVRESPSTPLKDSAIKNWSIKSFTQSFGSRGTYPLYKLREEAPGTENIPGLAAKDIVDLSAHYKNGSLSWDAPEGNWTILRFGWTCTGAVTSTNSDGWSGLSLDHLSAVAFQKFGDSVIVPLITTAQTAGSSLHYLQTDSWEMGNVGWTQDFSSAFKTYRGYDLLSFLPVLAGRIVGSLGQSDRFLQDYRKTIGDCIAANHYQLFSNLAHRYGLGFHPESGGPHSAPVDALKVMAINDFPQGEFWATANTHRVKDDERLVVKQSACVAHTNGKRYVAAEGPTSIGPQWERAPRDLKANIDRVFCSGVNRIVWHTFTSSPKEFGLPGNEYFAGTHLNPNVTWWKQAHDFIGYLNRCSYMLAQGLFAADVLYYYGDDVPNFVFLKEDAKDLRFGYDWDKCSKDALLKRLSVKDGKAVFPDGMSYRLLVLPAEDAIDLEVLRKLEALVKEGLMLIGPRPRKSTSLTGYPQCDAEINRIAERMWGSTNGTDKTENSYGKGKVVWGKNVNEVLEEMKVEPDLQFTSTQPATALDYIHRTGNGTDIYFVANRFARKGINDVEYRYLPLLPPNRYEHAACSFRVSGMVPERWDPLTGETKPILIYREEAGRTIIPLDFEPEGSLFIIFRKAAAAPHVTKIEKDGRPFFPANSFATGEQPFITLEEKGGRPTLFISGPGNYTLQWSDGKMGRHRLDAANKATTIDGPWNIQFDTTWKAPALVRFDSLQSWTSSAVEAVKYYSGSAVYKKTFSVSAADLKDAKVLLDLGNVQEMASIKINGHPYPLRWCAPFRFDITGDVKGGDNELEVEVTNLWPNRLIGDGKLPKEKRQTKTNIMKFDAPDADTLLRPSGMLGPVGLQFVHGETASPSR